MSSVDEKPWTPHPRGSGHAFVTALWGANAGYALGALVLGIRLQELSPHIQRVIVHTDDVPSNYLEAFEKDGLWLLRKVDYIDGVPDLYVSKGNIFDGVFTKLTVWTLEEYEKVLLLDIDIIPLKPLDGLFDLQCPAAMVRGQGYDLHGAEVDGCRFFGTEDKSKQDYPWGQSGGINAGLILLQLLTAMSSSKCSVRCPCKNHPCHVAGSGPEQDYLSRFFAARKESPWHHISVAFNYQLHQSLFAIERVLEWRAFMERSKGQVFSKEEEEWLPERLKMNLEDICVVHFSGEVKMWHRILEATTASSERDDQRREVSHALATTDGDKDGGNGDVVFAERMMSYQRGHSLWIFQDCRAWRLSLLRVQMWGAKDLCGWQGHHSGLRLDGEEGASCSCAGHQMFGTHATKSWLIMILGSYTHSKNHVFQKVVSTLELVWKSAGRWDKAAVQLWPGCQPRWWVFMTTRTTSWGLKDGVIGVTQNVMFTQNVWGPWPDTQQRAGKWMSSTNCPSLGTKG